MAQKMNPKDVISAEQAECYVTINKNRYNFMQLISFKAELDVKIGEVPILGKNMIGHKPGKISGKWSGTAHYNQSIFRKMWLEYKNTGAMPYFDIQATNEDPASSIGRQTAIMKDCLSEGGILAQFDADGEFLDEDMSGTFDDFELPEAFTLLTGMQ